jgi:hypothetical protein
MELAGVLGMPPFLASPVVRALGAGEMGEPSHGPILIVERVAGSISVLQLRQLLASLVERWDPPARLHVLIDLSHAVFVDCGLEDLIEAVRQADQASLRVSTRVALVATGDAYRAVANFCQTLSAQDDRVLGVFSDARVALTWIRSSSESHFDPLHPCA